jgi:lysophospholipase L1-like esterase
MVDHPGIVSSPDMWPDALAHLRAKHREGGHVNYIGGPADSITDGFGASSRENSWWSRFARTMARELGQPSRAIGSAEIALDSSWPVWTIRGTPAKHSGRSLGRHGIVLLRGTVASTVQPCDRIRLLVDETTTAFGMQGGSLEIRLDGEPVATLECHHDDVVGRLWDSGPLGDFEPRRIELTCVAGDFVTVGHSYFHDGADGTSGPLFWRNAHARYTAGRDEFGFASPASTWAGPLTDRVVGWNPFSDGPIVGGNAIAPDCFFCCTGTNDLGCLGDDRTSIARLYLHLVEYIRERCGDDPSIGFVVPTASAGAGVDQQALCDGIRDVCMAANCFMIDLWHGLGTHGDDRSGYYFDGLHPNDRGHAAWADYIARWMLEAIQADASPSSLSSAG